MVGIPAPDLGPCSGQRLEVLSERRTSGVKHPSLRQVQLRAMFWGERMCAGKDGIETVGDHDDVLASEDVAHFRGRELRWTYHGGRSTNRRSRPSWETALVGEPQWGQVLDREHLWRADNRKPQIEAMHQVEASIHPAAQQNLRRPRCRTESPKWHPRYVRELAAEGPEAEVDHVVVRRIVKQRMYELFVGKLLTHRLSGAPPRYRDGHARERSI
jgi:hypothetical protein